MSNERQKHKDKRKDAVNKRKTRHEMKMSAQTSLYFINITNIPVLKQPLQHSFVVKGTIFLLPNYNRNTPNVFLRSKNCFPCRL